MPALGGPLKEVQLEDVIAVRSNQKHWHGHGASPTTAMMHIAIQKPLDGRAVDWLNKVTDDLHKQT